MTQRIKLGVSACLMGDPVRYDGQSKFDTALVTALSNFAELVPLCPEHEAGLPVPRPPMRLVGNPASPRLLVISTGRDETPRLERWIAEKLLWLEREGICGLVLKSKSPSCGKEYVECFNEDGSSTSRSSGLFAAACRRACPLMPVADEKDIACAAGLWDFQQGIYAYRAELLKNSDVKSKSK